MKTQLNSLLLAAGLGIAASGCYTINVDYSPLNDVAALADPPVVQVTVVDSRPEDQGLGDTFRIGQYRGSFGIPQKVENGSPRVMERSVLAVTSDALAGAGVAVSDGATTVVEATVLQFWADGMVGFGGWVEVVYSVGDTEWTQTIEGSASGNGFFRNPDQVVETTVEAALVDLAWQAAEAFSSPEFQSAIQE